MSHLQKWFPIGLIPWFHSGMNWGWLTCSFLDSFPWPFRKSVQHLSIRGHLKTEKQKPCNGTSQLSLKPCMHPCDFHRLKRGWFLKRSVDGSCMIDSSLLPWNLFIGSKAWEKGFVKTKKVFRIQPSLHLLALNHWPYILLISSTINTAVGAFLLVLDAPCQIQHGFSFGFPNTAP